jgi:hypothetical protein
LVNWFKYPIDFISINYLLAVATIDDELVKELVVKGQLFN